MKVPYTLPLLMVFSLSFFCCKSQPKEGSIQEIEQVQQIKHLLETGSDAAYCNENKENLLHLAIRSQHKDIIRHVDNLFPQLRNKPDTTGYYPIHTAVANCSLGIVKLLDSLGHDFKKNVYQYQSSLGYRVIPSVQTVAAERFETQSRRSADSSDVGDTEAEAVYAYVIAKIYRYTWPRHYKPLDVVNQAKHHFLRGFPAVAHAFLNILRQHPERIKDLLDNYRLLESVDALLINDIPLPVDQENGRYFFQVIKANKPKLTQTFIKQGAVVNNMSVHKGKVYSALSYAVNSNSAENVELLVKAGATDSTWFELLVPGFWPTVSMVYDSSRLWYTIMADDNKTSVSLGKLNPEHFCIQRRQYWSNAKQRAIFMLATNKKEGIKQCETVISRPHLVTPDSSLHCKLKSGNSYELIIPPGSGTVLRVTTDGKSQDLLQYYPGKSGYSEFEPEDQNGVWIIWAGDIDSDGKLDLLLTGAQSDYANLFSTFYLALSSLAANDQLFGWADEVKVFGTYREFANNQYGRKPERLFTIPYFKMGEGEL